MTVTPQAIVAAIRTAPGWSRVGLTAPRQELRFDAYRALGDHVFKTLFPRDDEVDRDQLNLPL